MKRTSYFCSRGSALILLCLIALFTVRCKQGETISELSPSPSSSLNVNVDYAVNIAGAFHNNPQNKNARAAAGNKDSLIVDTKETLTDGGKPIFHVLNYKNNRGWIIVGADRRVAPILAYSHSGRFNLNKLPDGPKAWVEGVSKVVKKALIKLTKPEKMIENQWKHIEKTGGLNQSLPGGRIANSNCSSYDIYMNQCPSGSSYTNLGYPNSIIGNWGHNWTQGGGYAYHMPPNPTLGSNCGNCNNQVVAGCGPIATAMVLLANNRYKGSYKPYGYYFDQMSNYVTSNCSSINSSDAELARLIRFAYDQGGTFGSSCAQATLPDHIPNIFAGAGYSNSGQLVNFLTNQSQVKSDLHLGYPVVISGRTCETCYGGWHIWVIDGFQQNTYYNLDCSGYSPVCQESAFLFYSLKWGHGDNYSADGWYGVGNFSENGDVYDTALKVNINARP